MSRKVIGFITAFPESIYVQRLLKEMFSQCSKYGYNAAVFSPMSLNYSYLDSYIAGELNIYNLINFEKIDGVIVDTISLKNGGATEAFDMVLKLLREKCRRPVISIGEKLGEYPVIYTSSRNIFREITHHVMDIHGCKDIYFLAGPEDDFNSTDRLLGFFDVLESKNFTADQSKIFYGDFWYSSGIMLAERIISGELNRPDAVICANDQMAIGLANRLSKAGFKIPEDIIVTGFEATDEAVINPITITSFTPDYSEAMATAVNEIRKVIEPDKKVKNDPPKISEHLRIGSSCGCYYDRERNIDIFRSSLYYMRQDYYEKKESYDMGALIDSNMIEYLTDTASAKDFLKKLYHYVYLIEPYYEFYLCLDENWVNSEQCCKTGYPERIENLIYIDLENNTGFYDEEHYFDTALMIPQLDSDEETSVFYFMPVHFLNKSMGYAVLRRRLTDTHMLNCVVRNWMKNVGSALEIFRTQTRLMSLSIKDGMTGAYNRRGMKLMLDDLISNANSDDSIMALVIDMDRLKAINDTYGHENGDFGINAVCKAAMSITYEKEICVRAGGDEFYVIGIGEYSPEDINQRIVLFEEKLTEINKKHNKPYLISASIGSACIPLIGGADLTRIIKIADAKMYENKVRKKVQRKE